MATIKINGVTVDMEKPCDVAAALEAARIKVLAGEAVAESTLRSAVTGEDIVFHKADLAALGREVAYWRGLCAAANGQRRARRAIRAGFRTI